jgi:hypothetical protein
MAVELRAAGHSIEIRKNALDESLPAWILRIGRGGEKPDQVTRLAEGLLRRRGSTRKESLLDSRIPCLQPGTIGHYLLRMTPVLGGLLGRHPTAGVKIDRLVCHALTSRVRADSRGLRQSSGYDVAVERMTAPTLEARKLHHGAQQEMRLYRSP